jgi:cytoskeletal protein CcmA (bactofilin family)
MWHKTDGKPSPETPQPPAGINTKSQVAPEPPALSAVSPSPTEPVPTAAPRAEVPEPAVVAAPAPFATGTSRIQAGLKVHGEISGNSDLYIDGELQGKLRLGNGRVVIGPNGKVQADIEASGVTIEGFVQGNIKATESVRLGPGSRVQGSVLTPRIGIDDGARLRGKVEMVKAGSSVSTPAASSATSATEIQVSQPIAASAKAK